MRSLDPDLIVDRRRLKRMLSFWRAAAIVAAVAVVAVGAGRVAWFERDRVARLDVSGIVLGDDDRLRAVRAAAKDERVKALLVRIDSPGGAVVGSAALFRELREVAARKPVVAVMADTAASGGYMVALGADRIFASEGTITGSIGVLLQTADVTGLLGKLGISVEALKSSPLKAVPSPLEPLTPAGREATMELVRDMHAMFVDMVAERRGLTRERALELADGRVYTGRQARRLGLIDALGGEDEARAWLAEKGVDRDLPTKVLKIEREDGDWTGWVARAASVLAGKTYLPERLKLDGLVALWHPDLAVR